METQIPTTPYAVQPPTLVDSCWHFLSVVDTVDLLVVHTKRRVVDSCDDFPTLFTRVVKVMKT